ncbi:MAG: hypothetical protein NC489_35530 [Ruminococcus flavefaciens]|nr:hypothetical protein [Ruminococcus flavefaciens]
MKHIKLSDIKIKESFANSVPNEEKMEQCRQFWNTYHKQDRLIMLNNMHTLVDGYIQYLVLKENNVDEAEVCFVNSKTNNTYRERETTYIYGIHLNSRSKKEIVWRIPDGWGHERCNELDVGDRMLVKTKYGLAPIKITKIERLSKCPVEIPVKTVVRKLREVKE